MRSSHFYIDDTRNGACRRCRRRATPHCAAQFPKSCSQKQENKTIAAIFTPFNSAFFLGKKKRKHKAKRRVKNHLVFAWSEPYHIVDIWVLFPPAAGQAAGYLRQRLLPGNRTTGRRAVMGTWRRKRTHLPPPAEELCSRSSVGSTCASQRPRHPAHDQRHTTHGLHPLLSMVMQRILSHTHTHTDASTCTCTCAMC